MTQPLRAYIMETLTMLLEAGLELGWIKVVGDKLYVSAHRGSVFVGWCESLVAIEAAFYPHQLARTHQTDLARL